MKLSVIGKGNVGSHLYELFSAIKGYDVSLVDSRTLKIVEGQRKDKILNDSSDLILISVSDSSIMMVAKSVFDLIGENGAVVAHTAGSVSMEILSRYFENYGVFYPLQTFTKGVELVRRDFPVFIEANNVTTLDFLKDVAEKLTENVVEMESDERKYLHLASVFSCNFINAMAGIGEDILSQKGIDPKLLSALIHQTVSKLETMSPLEAQTGPARRNDKNVMQKHLEMLETKPHYQKIYQEISELIRNNYEQDKL